MKVIDGGNLGRTVEKSSGELFAKSGGQKRSAYAKVVVHQNAGSNFENNKNDYIARRCR